jgi:hypothetical protein
MPSGPGDRTEKAKAPRERYPALTLRLVTGCSQNTPNGSDNGVQPRNLLDQSWTGD